MALFLPDTEIHILAESFPDDKNSQGNKLWKFPLKSADGVMTNK